VGSAFTEADLRLFMTLVRFDEVYVVYFKCNVRRLVDYPNIRNYLRDVYQLVGMSESISMEHIKTHYFT
jgi:putative glutathione S-transferase